MTELDEVQPAATYDIVIDPAPDAGLAGLRATFGRVTVLLGANGSGKSKLMEALKSQAYEGVRPVVYVEGGRTVAPPDSLGLKPKELRLYQSVSVSTATHQAQLKESLSSRVKHAFMLLDQLGQEKRLKHS